MLHEAGVDDSLIDIITDDMPAVSSQLQSEGSLTNVTKSQIFIPNAATATYDISQQKVTIVAKDLNCLEHSQPWVILVKALQGIKSDIFSSLKQEKRAIPSADAIETYVVEIDDISHVKFLLILEILDGLIYFSKSSGWNFALNVLNPSRKQCNFSLNYEKNATLRHIKRLLVEIKLTDQNSVLQIRVNKN